MMVWVFVAGGGVWVDWGHSGFCGGFCWGNDVCFVCLGDSGDKPELVEPWAEWVVGQGVFGMWEFE